jgi:hypothetical protein
MRLCLDFIVTINIFIVFDVVSHEHTHVKLVFKDHLTPVRFVIVFNANRIAQRSSYEWTNLFEGLCKVKSSIKKATNMPQKWSQ